MKNFQPELNSVDYKYKPQLSEDEKIENIEVAKDLEGISPIGN